MTRRIQLGGIALLVTTLFLGNSTPAAADPAAGVVAVDSVNDAAAAAGRGVSVAREVDGSLTIDNYVAPTPAAAHAYVEKVSDDEGVRAASVAQPVQALSDDPLYSTQWDAARLGLDNAHAMSTGAGVVVAVVDTGVEASHSDLSGQILPGTDYINPGGDGRTDPNGHGTHVSGTIAAKTDNAIGVEGIAPGAKILPVRVLDSSGSGWDSDISNGIIWATDNGANVINLSLGGSTYSSVEETAVNYATSHGVLVVAAAGNSGNTGNPVMYPAAFTNSFSVAATASDDTVPAWSEHNAYVDIAAPGDSILSTTIGNNYGYKSGTSMASPHVAGVAALVMAQNPGITVAQVRDRLTSTAIDMGASGRDDYYGAGLVNPVSALSVGNSVGGNTPTPSVRGGAWTTAGDGGVFSFSGAQFYGSTGNISLNKPIVGMATTGTGNGYRFVAADGGIFAFGDASFQGSMGDKHLNQPIVGMASTPSGNGYWLVASDGGIFAFGDANFFGSTGAIKLNKPIVGMTSTPDGRGYWLVASDGGVFAFGNARFFGSAGGQALSAPVAGIAATASGNGYYIVTSSGAVYAYGDASYKGGLSTSGIVAITSTSSGSGYVIAGADGSITSFGDATALVTSTGRMRLNRPVVGISLVAH